MAPDDVAHMHAALALARRGLGNTWPNPAVGCVVIKDGRVIGRAVTAPGGRPHAEAIALQAAGAAARGATAYVTLEPCCHWGRTPPCTDALIGAGISRVVIGTRDPDPRVQGRGVARLRAAGIPLEEDVLMAEAREVLAGFSQRVQTGRPLVTLKLASTLDGRIATREGKSRWITGLAARRTAHALRGRHDAVLVGVGTVLMDDPDLSCRLPGFRPTPVVRIVADSHLRTPPTARLAVTAAQAPTWILHRPGADPGRRQAFREASVRLFEISSAEIGIDLEAALTALGTAGITRLLVEGGAQFAAALLRTGLVDRLAWFHAPSVMGGDGWAGVQALGIDRLDEIPRFIRHRVTQVGEDILTELVRQG